MRYSLHRTRAHRLRYIVAFGLLALAVVASAAVWTYSKGAASHPTKTPTQAKITKKVDSGGLTSRMLFVGDVFWGRTIQTKAERSGLGYTYPTSGLTKADWNQYDAHIANFECPITTKDVPLSQQIDILKFNCRPEYLANLANWFTAGGQANNHTMNNGGQWGMQQTRQNMEKAGIQYFGNYDMSKTDDICEVITVPATTERTHKKVSLPVALCGYMYVVDVAPTDSQLAVMRKYAKVMPVIAMPHMGVEYRPTAEAEKVSAYHRMIDNGADMVIGAHPHVIQNSEDYKGHLIAYSEGNFLFDQQSLGRKTTLGLGVGLKLTVKNEKAAQIYEKIAPSCASYKDDCAMRLAQQFARRPVINVSYSYTCFDEAGGVPTLGSPPVCALADKMATTDQLSGLSADW